MEVSFVKNKQIKLIITSALFAALAAGLTLFPTIPIPGGGYVHLGDAMILIAASFLPLPYAMTAAAIGGGLADLISGYAVYIPFTIAAKALLTVAFTSKSEKILTKRNIAAPFLSVITTPLVYFCADSILYSVSGAIPGIVWNLCQAAASIIVYFIISAAFDKTALKSKLAGKM